MPRRRASRPDQRGAASKVPDGVLYGDYLLLGRLAAGGMAEVFLAKHRDPDRQRELLALKRLLLQFVDNDDFTSMFRDEARIVSRLSHPNICRTIAHGTHGKQHYMVMEFVQGKSLDLLSRRARKQGSSVPFTLVAYILARVADALEHAHQLHGPQGGRLNLVHRDVSPQNILIDYEGVPKLIDFGIAKAKGRVAETRAGVVKGKFSYMSPEQAGGKDVDARTDIFALGIVLYEMLTGKLPFTGESDLDLLNKIVSGRFQDPAMVSSRPLPKELLAICRKAMAINKARRYQSAREMGAALDDYVKNRVNRTKLSQYVQTLFAKEYRREKERIDGYLAISAPKKGSREEQSMPAVEGESHTEEISTGEIMGDPTVALQAAPDLAAGYQEGHGFSPTGQLGIASTAPDLLELEGETTLGFEGESTSPVDRSARGGEIRRPTSANPDFLDYDPTQAMDQLDGSEDELGEEATRLDLDTYFDQLREAKEGAAPTRAEMPPSGHGQDSRAFQGPPTVDLREHRSSASSQSQQARPRRSKRPSSASSGRFRRSSESIPGERRPSGRARTPTRSFELNGKERLILTLTAIVCLAVLGYTYYDQRYGAESVAEILEEAPRKVEAATDPKADANKPR